MIEQSAAIFKALGEPTRLRIIKFLSLRELCICELVAILDISQPRISQHVKVLKQAGLVTERKYRQNSYISLNQDVLQNANILPFRSFLQTEIAELAELEAENQRFLQLATNEQVNACKNNPPPDI